MKVNSSSSSETSRLLLPEWTINVNATMQASFQLGASLVLLCSLFCAGAAAQAQEGTSRQIVLEEFTRARPTIPAVKTQIESNRASANMHGHPRYRRVTRQLSSEPKTAHVSNSELGLTVWRLRPAKAEEETGARLLVMEESQQTQWTPERVEADTLLKVADRVRISVESPRPGYLYVIDRERYADGSLGDAYLIFPTTRTRGGDNQVRPGKLIDIPAQEDTPNYFTLVPSANRNDQVGEVLSLLVTSRPLPLEITDKPLLVRAEQLVEWEKLWGAKFERFEMEGGAGLPWTKEEKEAAKAKSSRYLTQQEPAPQTIYRLATTRNGPVLVTLNLSYRNR